MTIYYHKSRNLLGAKHGFYTRKGGVSSGIYRGLNCGLGSNDNSKLVNQNRSLVAQSMNVSPSALTFVHQHHSSDVITANKRVYNQNAKTYDKTIFVEEALHRLVEINYKIGLEEEAKAAAVLLGYNYNSSEWYEKSYKILNKDYKPIKIDKKKDDGLVRRTIKKILFINEK